MSFGLGRAFIAGVLVLVVGAAGGLAGGYAATRLDDQPAASGSPSAEAATLEAPAYPDAVRRAVERVLPAVVTVVADSAPIREADGSVRQTRNLGSGVVVNDAGYVITNFHVVEGAETFSIVLATGEERPARIVGDDSPFADLAVLAVPPQGLRSAVLGDSARVRVGDTVVAVAGGAITSGNSASVGVVSGTNRAWPRAGVLLEDLVQTDAAVNHGDSGGALVDLRGEVVGLLTTVVRETPNGLAIQGVAFAQSSNSLRAAIDSIARTGTSGRPRIGIERLSQHLEVSPELAAQQGLPVEYGALVTAVAAGSPAAGAGLRAGDIVVGLNGIAIDFDNPLVNLLKRLGPGENAELFYLRNGSPLRVTLTPRLE